MEQFYGIQTVVKVLFIGSFFIGSSYSAMLAGAACMMAVYRRLKRVEFSRAYLQEVLRNEYGSNLFFILTFTSINKSIFFYAPLTLHFITGIVQYLNFAHKNNTFVIRYLSQYIDTVRNNRKLFLTTKAKIEFVYLPITLILTLFNFSRIISTLVYAQYILLRSKMGGDFSEAMTELDNQLYPVANRFGLSGIYRKVKGLMQTIKNKLG